MAKKILIVEDELVLNQMYQKLLQNYKYEVSVALNGEEGLKLALGEHPDLILLDILMPKMDGMTMLKRLRTDSWGKSAKVIVLTNLDADGSILQGVVEDSPTYYLLKAGTTPGKLLEHVGEILGEQKSESAE